MTISALINSLAPGALFKPRLRAPLIKDRYCLAVYFHTTKGVISASTSYEVSQVQKMDKRARVDALKGIQGAKLSR